MSGLSPLQMKISKACLLVLPFYRVQKQTRCRGLSSTGALSYLPVTQAEDQLFFHLISWLYKRTSISVTMNLAVGEWPFCLAMRR